MTCASLSRTSAGSGPPRARIACSRSGAASHAAAASSTRRARPRRLRTPVPRSLGSPSVCPVARLGVALAGADDCRGCGRTRTPDPAPRRHRPSRRASCRSTTASSRSASTYPENRRDRSPRSLALLGERPRMLAAGLVVISLPGALGAAAAARGRPRRPSRGRAGAARGASGCSPSPPPGRSASGYFEVITDDATKTIPRVLDAVLRLPEIDATAGGNRGHLDERLHRAPGRGERPRLIGGRDRRRVRRLSSVPLRIDPRHGRRVPRPRRRLLDVAALDRAGPPPRAIRARGRAAVERVRRRRDSAPLRARHGEGLRAGLCGRGGVRTVSLDRGPGSGPRLEHGSASSGARVVVSMAPRRVT